MTQAWPTPIWSRLIATVPPANDREDRSDRRALSGVTLLYAVLAAAAVFTNGPIRYVADNRYEQYQSPWRVLSRTFWMWDGTRGLGAPRDDVWIGTTLPVAIARSFGLSIAIAERSFHAACLVLLGLGVVVVLRGFRPSVRAEHVMAGLLAMFNPFTASFLVPTNLFLMVAMCPWFVVAFHRGITGTRPWAWAAVFALLVLFAGNGDVPGLMYVGIFMLLVGVYSVTVDRSASWTRVAGWLARAVALALATGSWAAVKTLGAADALEARLMATELPAASSLASSWSESWRGLGNWLSYFREDGRLTKPQAVPYFDRPLVVLSTFVVPVIALVVVWRGRWRGRLFFGLMMATAVVLMVGGFAAPDASPLGRAILGTLERNSLLTSLRNTYKAGGGLVVGASVLAAVGIVEAARAARVRSRSAGAIACALGAVVVVTSAFPFTMGSLYHPDEQFQSVPEYWHEAISYLDELPVGGRSLIVPAVSQTRYRWGYVGDDIFDALLNRPHATATGWMLSTRPAHAALEAVTLAAQSPNYRTGVIGPMARRLGITEIVIRNDIDWRRVNAARPIAFAGLRADADLELVASFGPPGARTTVYPLDTSLEAVVERELPAIEVYRVRGATGLVTATAGRADTLVVAGDAHSWPQLATAGMLADETRLLSSGALSNTLLEAELGQGARIIVTDTERRRVLTLLHHEPQLSQTLAVDQMLDRPPTSLFAERSQAESVAWHTDALAIGGSFVRLGGNRTDRRPALAFDGDPGTAWAVPSTGLAGPGAGLEVTLRAPTTVTEMSFLTTLSPDGSPTVRGLDVEFSDGTTVPVDVADDGTAEVSIAPHVTTSVTVVVTEVDSIDREVGIAEIGIGDLDLVEYIRSPIDLTTRGGTTATAVASTPTAYTFRRVARATSGTRPLLVSSAYDEEVSLNRRFDITHDDTFGVSGTVVVTAATSDEMIASLVGTPVVAIGDRDPGAQIDGPAVLTLDDDPATAWRGAARPGVGVTVRVPEQSLRQVLVSIPDDVGTARISTVRLDVAGRRYDAPTDDANCSGRQVLTCTRVATFTLPDGVVGSSVRVTADEIDAGRVFDPDQVRISEIEVIGDATNGIDRAGLVTDGCVDLGIRIGMNGTIGRAVDVRITGPVGDIVSGRPVGFVACDELQLTPGAFLLRTLPGSPIDGLALVPTSWSPPPAPAAVAPVTWLVQSPDRWSGQVEFVGPVEVVSRTSFDPGWELEVGGQRVPAHERDGVNAWVFEADGTTSFDVEYVPSRSLRLALVLTLCGTAISLLVLAGSLFGRRSVAPRAATATSTSTDRLRLDRPRRHLADATVLVIVPLFGFVLAGLSGLAAGMIISVIVHFFPGLRQVLGIAAPALLVAAAVQTAVLAGSVSIMYSQERWAPSSLAQLAMVFLVSTLCVAIGRDRGERADHAGRRQRFGQARAAARARTRRRRIRVANSWRAFASWSSIAVPAVTAGLAAALRPHRDGVPAAVLYNLRLGIGLTADGASGALAIQTPPLSAAIAAFAPRLADVFVMIAVVSTVTLAASLAREWSGGSLVAGVRSGLAVAEGLAVWGPALPAALALALVTAAAVVVDRAPGLTAPAVAGTLIGLAVLAQPAALLALFVVVWCLKERRIADHLTSSMIAAVMAWLVSAPWLAAVIQIDGVDGLGRQLASLTWVMGVVVAAIGSLSVRARRHRRGAAVAAVLDSRVDEPAGGELIEAI